MSYWINIPLIVSAYTGDESRVFRLLSQGEDINIQCCNGCTPLILASMKGHERIVSLLIERGANISHKNRVRVIIISLFDFYC